MDPKEAERLARIFVGAGAELTLCAGPPDALYLSRPAETELFHFVGRPRRLQVGGCEVIAVDRSTGEVRAAGFVGE